jgi:hypothetical protein
MDWLRQPGSGLVWPKVSGLLLALGLVLLLLLLLALVSALESVSPQNSMKPSKRLRQCKVSENKNVRSCFWNLETRI